MSLRGGWEMTRRRCPLALATLAATIGLLLITGCASSYNSLTNYPNQARLSVWPKNHDTVARNAAVWVEVTPSYARVTDFEIVEMYGGSRYSVAFTSSKRTYSNEYLFCPAQNLSPYSRYEVWLQVDFREEYKWRFDTSGCYAGNPYECYYITRRSDGAVVMSTESDAPVIQGEADWEPFELAKTG